MAKVLVTGGAGYIGTHTVVELLHAGHEVVVVDNLVNSHREALERVFKITGQRVPFYPYNVCDEEKLDQVFKEHEIHAVIHFAGLKAVGESCEKPLLYYQQNIASTLSLLSVMSRYNVYNLVFSSSATVYGDPKELPLKEDVSSLGAMNPYGRTKWIIEMMLQDVAASAPSLWHIALLRYFNPVGAHESGLIGEDPQGIPNNLMPFISQVAVKRRTHLNVFGADYPTKDGTCLRDYIHVVDLAKGHLAALKHLPVMADPCRAFNLGTGTPHSVLEVLTAFEKANDVAIPYEFTSRRQGDVVASYACVDRALKELGWKAEKDLLTMCRDSWRWQKGNPKGFHIF